MNAFSRNKGTLLWVSFDISQQGGLMQGGPRRRHGDGPGPWCKTPFGAHIVFIIIIIQYFNKYANVTLMIGFNILKDSLDILRF